ncbi:ArsR/SmtB family transcription factor [Streptomyces shenzhenensis]
MVEELALTQPQVSTHLRVLRDVGAVDVREDGRHRLYRLNAEALKPIHDWVGRYEGFWSARSTGWTPSSRVDECLPGMRQHGALRG